MLSISKSNPLRATWAAAQGSDLVNGSSFTHAWPRKPPVRFSQHRRTSWQVKHTATAFFYPSQIMNWLSSKGCQKHTTYSIYLPVYMFWPCLWQGDHCSQSGDAETGMGKVVQNIAYMYQNKMQEIDNMILGSIDISKNKCIFIIKLTSLPNSILCEIRYPNLHMCRDQLVYFVGIQLCTCQIQWCLTLPSFSLFMIPLITFTFWYGSSILSFAHRLMLFH